MKIKRSPVVFHNLLKMTDICRPDEWQTIALVMRNFTMQNGLYVNAPIVYQYVKDQREDGLSEFTVYLPINRSVEIEEDIPITFLPELKFDDALTFRLADLETEIVEEAYILLDACALEQGYELEKPFYHVHMSLYGENMIDVVAPIIAVGGADASANTQMN